MLFTLSQNSNHENQSYPTLVHLTLEITIKQSCQKIKQSDVLNKLNINK